MLSCLLPFNHNWLQNDLDTEFAHVLSNRKITNMSLLIVIYRELDYLINTSCIDFNFITFRNILGSKIHSASLAVHLVFFCLYFYLFSGKIESQMYTTLFSFVPIESSASTCVLSRIWIRNPPFVKQSPGTFLCRKIRPGSSLCFCL